MEESNDRRVLEQHGTDVIKYRATSFWINFVANGMLHPRISSKDEVRGEHGADSSSPNGGQVKLLRKAVPTKDPQSQESRFKEKRQQALHS